MTTLTRLGATLGSLTVLATISGAQIFYNNFDATNSYAGNGWTISGGGTVSFFEQGFGFTSLANGQLGTITMSLMHVTGVNSYTVTLRSEAGGLPDAPIASWSISNLGAYGAPATVINVTGGPTLTTGTRYWITAAADDASSWAAWYQTNTTASSTRAYRQSSSAPWSNGGGATEGGLRLDAAPVPEPASVLTLSLGAAAIARRRRTRGRS